MSAGPAAGPAALVLDAGLPPVPGRAALVTVIVPTFDHADTVDLTLASISAQTVTDLDIVVIGDGATEAVRTVVDACAGSDPRIRPLWMPASAGRGEQARHAVVLGSVASIVCYVGDDDLLLPNHVELMVGLLGDADFAHPLPLSVLADGSGLAHCGDLSWSDSRRWHRQPGRNAVSLSGVAHRVEPYRTLRGWEAAPPGTWSDHHMWQQWLARPDIRYASATVPSVIKLDSSLRPEVAAGARRAEISAWASRLGTDELTADLMRLALEAHRVAAIRERLAAAAAVDDLVPWSRRVDDLEAAVADVAAERGRLGALAEERAVALAESASVVAVLRADLEAARASVARLEVERAHLLITRQQAADEVLRTRDERDANAVARDECAAGLASVAASLAAAESRRSAVEATRWWRLHDRLLEVSWVRRVATLARAA